MAPSTDNPPPAEYVPKVHSRKWQVESLASINLFPSEEEEQKVGVAQECVKKRDENFVGSTRIPCGTTNVLLYESGWRGKEKLLLFLTAAIFFIQRNSV